MEDNKTVLYEYSRNGKVFITPNEQIAMLRSDNGYYTIVEIAL